MGLEEALEQALHVENVEIEHHDVKREADNMKEDTGDLESLLDGHGNLHVVKRSAEPSPDEFVAYGNSMDEAKDNAMKMAREMYGEDFGVRFR